VGAGSASTAFTGSGGGVSATIGAVDGAIGAARGAFTGAGVA